MNPRVLINLNVLVKILVWIIAKFFLTMYENKFKNLLNNWTTFSILIVFFLLYWIKCIFSVLCFQFPHPNSKYTYIYFSLKSMFHNSWCNERFSSAYIKKHIHRISILNLNQIIWKIIFHFSPSPKYIISLNFLRLGFVKYCTNAKHTHTHSYTPRERDSGMIWQQK